MNFLQFVQGISNQIIEWLVYHSMELILIGVLLILWKIFWEIS
jgi:hypothetical protein